MNKLNISLKNGSTLLIIIVLALIIGSLAAVVSMGGKNDQVIIRKMNISLEKNQLEHYILSRVDCVETFATQSSTVSSLKLLGLSGLSIASDIDGFVHSIANWRFRAWANSRVIEVEAWNMLESEKKFTLFTDSPLDCS